MMIGFLLFFIGFYFLEAILPSLVAKYSDVNTKGTAMGVFSTSQFSGIFAGGIVGGFVATHWGISGVMYLGAILAVIWFIIAIRLPTPVFYKARVIHLKSEFLDNPIETSKQLMLISGIKEVAVAVEEGAAYLKVKKDELDEDSLMAFVGKRHTLS
jgi:MFS family permease